MIDKNLCLAILTLYMLDICDCVICVHIQKVSLTWVEVVYKFALWLDFLSLPPSYKSTKYSGIIGGVRLFKFTRKAFNHGEGTCLCGEGAYFYGEAVCLCGEEVPRSGQRIVFHRSVACFHGNATHVDRNATCFHGEAAYLHGEKASRDRTTAIFHGEVWFPWNTNAFVRRSCVFLRRRLGPYGLP